MKTERNLFPSNLSKGHLQNTLLNRKCKEHLGLRNTLAVLLCKFQGTIVTKLQAFIFISGSTAESKGG